MAFYKAPRYVLRKRNILSFTKNLDAKTFVDVGCGAGELACTLASTGLSGVGLDFSDNAIETANTLKKSRKIPSKNLEFIVGDQKKLGTKKYDLIICCEVLEHVEDDKALLKTLVGISKKYVLISVPAKQKLFDDSDKAVGHFRRYEKDQIKELITSNDLDIVKFASYGYPFTNMVRLARKVFFKIKLKNDKQSTENRTKDSGINPIKLPSAFSKIDIEKIMIPFYWFSRLFNRTNLSEGYLILCKKKSD